MSEFNFEIVEMIHRAQINFENLEKSFPSILTHPFYKVAKMQLDEAVKALGR